MRARIAAIAAFVVIAYGCASSKPAPPLETQALHGVASWYGEEFAGRTTANGEIFDPLLLTAAHRTLPFGTIIDVTNPKTSQTVRVRVNDRGPYIGNRVIDLSYAAAQQVGLIEPGTGDVDIKVVKLGNGDREPPAPFDVTIAEAPQTVPVIATADATPKVDFPLPPAVTPEPPVVVDRVDLEVQHGDVVTRKEVSPDGKTIVDMPVAGAQPVAVEAGGRGASRYTTVPAKAGFVVQVGAFAIEANAKQLLDRLGTIGQRAWIDHEDLYRVRIGPFATRDDAVKTRAALEASGISAMVVAQ